jgi:hypothetical protein
MRVQKVKGDVGNGIHVAYFAVSSVIDRGIQPQGVDVVVVTQKVCGKFTSSNIQHASGRIRDLTPAQPQNVRKAVLVHVKVVLSGLCPAGARPLCGE